VNSSTFIHCPERFFGATPDLFSLWQPATIEAELTVRRRTSFRAAFPKSWNVYDGLGEACMNDGEENPAIANYEKSLELNGSNTGAVEALKKLKGTPQGEGGEKASPGARAGARICSGRKGITSLWQSR
jgi:hypothetical protein